MEQLTEQPVSEQPITEADIEPDAPASIMEHARTFGPQAEKAEPDPDPLKPIRPVDQQKREAGKFAEGRKPMRAKDAVERINQLTGRAKSAEERYTAAEGRLAQVERELSELRQGGGTRSEVAQAERKVDQAQATVDRQQADPSGFKLRMPLDTDPEFDGDFVRYMDAKQEWIARKVRWEERQDDQRQSVEAKQHQVWDTRIAAAVAKYPDYMNVARSTLQKVPPQSALHVFIEDDPTGEDVLYYLGTNTQELDAILRMPTALAQVKALSLLSQRLTASPTSPAAGTTGSVAGRPKSTPLPRPLNPVRTEAQRATDGPPPLDGSLSVMGHAKQFRRA